MADVLGSAGFVVQQALHGYGDGHRLLAASASLPPTDARVMLVLSDASGSSAEFPANGYLTGYPLAGSAKFVLARTWPAPEMSRPGCVWTHSLLIDFGDLARMRSATGLIELFRRPEGGSRRRYETPLKVAASPARRLAKVGDVGAATAALGTLYRRPKQKVVAQYSDSSDEILILAVWMQQWPRLRRGFRFCSFAASDRSTSGESFDLQLVDRNILAHRFRLPGTAIASITEFTAALEPLLDDLLSPDCEGLRSFLRDVGGDVASGRAGMLPLTRLFAATRSSTFEQGDISTAFEALDELGPAQATQARAFVVEQALSQVEKLGGPVFQLIMDSVASTGKELSKPLAERFGRALWSYSPARFAEALSEGGVVGNAADSSLRSLSREDLIEGLATFPNAADGVLKRRHDLLADPLFWRLPGLETDTLLEAVAADPGIAAPVLGAMVSSGRGDIADMAVQRLGGARVIEALKTAANIASSNQLVPWLNALAPTDLASALAGGIVRERSLLVAIARTTHPDSVPNDYGDDPWAIAVDGSTESLDIEADDFLGAFLLARGLGHRSRSPGRLLSQSLERVHSALAAGRMPRAGWQLIDMRLPWVWSWFEWDRCARVREAVVDRFIGSNLDPAHFATLASEDSLWHSLVDLAARVGHGRRYLQRVRRTLTEAPDARQRERAEYIKECLH